MMNRSSGIVLDILEVNITSILGTIESSIAIKNERFLSRRKINQHMGQTVIMVNLKKNHSLVGPGFETGGGGGCLCETFKISDFGLSFTLIYNFFGIN